jgi:peroxiredoxin
MFTKYGGPSMSLATRIQPGTILGRHELVTIRSERISLPNERRLVHLQFRRFAGCPVCDLHLHSFAQRHEEIVAASIQEIIVFHSSAEELRPYAAMFPFDVVADPEKRLYAEFRVESAPRALLDPRVWVPVLRGILRSLAGILRGQQPIPSLSPRGGRLGLPADFLIASDGHVLECKYGSHAYDQWSVNDVLRLAAAEFPERQTLETTPGRSYVGFRNTNQRGIMPALSDFRKTGKNS